MKKYPNVVLDDLEGTKDNPCLVVWLSDKDPKLSVDVFRTRAQATAVSIAVIPSLLEQGVHKHTVSVFQDTNTCRKCFQQCKGKYKW